MESLKLAITLAALPTLAAADVPLFIERTENLPVEHVYNGGWEHYVGGGVAVLDCNGDDFPDFLAAGGENPTRLFVNQTEAPAGALAFAVADGIPETTAVTGAYPIDIDNDGVLDLVILRAGPNQVWKGGGDCAFTDVTAAWGVDPGQGWTTAFSATWEAGGTWPTLALGNYVDRDDPEGPFGTCDANYLLRPGQSGYRKPQPIEPSYCTLSLLFSDYLRRGVQDLRVSNDRHYYGSKGSEQMWRMPELKELDQTAGWDPLSIWGMSIASEDLTGDGRPEVMLSSMGDQVMQISTDAGFTQAPFELGTYAHRPYVGDDTGVTTGWHAQFGDVDNDGLADLFIAKGNVDEMPEAAMDDPNNLLMQGSDGTFAEAGDQAGVASFDRSRGAALADLNQDGWLDLIVVNRRAPLQLYQNPGLPDRNWIAVTPEQAGSNRFAIGAWVEIRDQSGTRTKEITIGGGHAGGQAGPVHFGLNSAEFAEIRILWPDGTAGPWQIFNANAHHVIRRHGG